MKKIIGLIISIIIIFILSTIIISYFILNNGTFLTNFKFKNVSNVGLNYYIYFDKVPAAKNYDVIVYDSENIIIYKDNIKKNSTTIEFNKLNFNELLPALTDIIFIYFLPLSPV